MAVGGRHENHDHSCRLMRALGKPPLVFPNHFDACDRPLDQAMRARHDDDDDLDALASEIQPARPRSGCRCRDT